MELLDAKDVHGKLFDFDLGEGEIIKVQLLADLKKGLSLVALESRPYLASVHYAVRVGEPVLCIESAPEKEPYASLKCSTWNTIIEAAKAGRTLSFLVSEKNRCGSAPNLTPFCPFSKGGK
jgi:hypothetical protein